ncbi:hypothetical protein [Tautonia sociabilis]|uniref:Uncharacterized protein n=1 Tax=Tautonia sociabilis TaxID=2080755 RepID=A0A432MK27_9BACT|nr:hypothetical protein [Tautonia sociabilis]RUL87476.1 hypothetical protein TsocGM_12420 [Tautonia sociabilis]
MNSLRSWIPARTLACLLSVPALCLASGGSARAADVWKVSIDTPGGLEGGQLNLSGKYTAPDVPGTTQVLIRVSVYEYEPNDGGTGDQIGPTINIQKPDNVTDGSWSTSVGGLSAGDNVTIFVVLDNPNDPLFDPVSSVTIEDLD